MTQCLIEHDPDAGREIEASNGFVRHWDIQASIRICVEQIFGQAACFAAKDKAIVFGVFPICIKPLSFGRNVQKTRIWKMFVETFEIDMTVQINVFPIVEAGAFQRPVVHPKTGDADNMQAGIRCGAEPGDVAGIRRYLWFDKRDVHKN